MAQKGGPMGELRGTVFANFSQCLKAFPAIWGWTSENSCHFSHISSHIISNSGHKNKKRSHEIKKKRHEFKNEEFTKRHKTETAPYNLHE